MDLESLKNKLHQQLLNLRNIENTISHIRFTNLWELSTDTQCKEVIKFIKENNHKKIVDWIQKHNSLELGEKSLKELKELGKKLGIANWSRLPKCYLIRDIIRKQEERKII